MLIGIFCASCFYAPLSIPNIPEMMLATATEYPSCDEDYANSLLSGILNSTIGLGECLGPILGSLFY